MIERTTTRLFINLMSVQIDWAKPKKLIDSLLTVYSTYNYKTLSTGIKNNSYDLKLIICSEIIFWESTARNSYIDSLQYFKFSATNRSTTKANRLTRGRFAFAKYPLLMAPVWYENDWSWTLILTLIVIGVGSILAVRLKYAQREDQHLESLVAKRTEALQHTLDQLKESESVLNRQVHLQSRLMVSIAHDIQSPLRFVTYTSRQAHQLVIDQNYEALSRITETIANTTENTGYLLNDLLSYTKAKFYDGDRAVELVNLHALLAKKSALFTSILHARQTTFLNEIPVDFQVSTDSHLLGIIMHNLLDNAVKYTTQGFIRVHVCPNGQPPRVVITNGGIPMNAQTLAWFNQVDDDRNDHPLSAPQRGSGLLLIKEIASLINIKLVAQQTDVTAMHILFGNGEKGVEYEAQGRG